MTDQLSIPASLPNPASALVAPTEPPTPRLDPARPMVGRRHRRGPDTEQEAARCALPRKGTQRAAVLDMFRRYPEGLTDYELWTKRIGARPHVPGTRREELIADGWPIVDSGRRRPTDTGAPAIVWRLEERA